MDAGLVEETLCEVHAHLARRVPGARRHDVDGLDVTVSGLPLAPLNKAANARLDVASAPAAVEASLDVLERGNAPFFWWLTPASRPLGLSGVLAGRGLRRVASFAAMAAPFDDLRPPPVPEGLTFEPARDAPAIGAFLRAYSEGFGIPPEGQAHWRLVFDAVFPEEDGPMVPLVGRLDGEPVATGVVFVGTRAMALHSIATRPDLARRGIGSAMTFALARERWRRGARVATLESTQAGENAYRALGFHDVGAFEAWTRP